MNSSLCFVQSCFAQIYIYVCTNSEDRLDAKISDGTDRNIASCEILKPIRALALAVGLVLLLLLDMSQGHSFDHTDTSGQARVQYGDQVIHVSGKQAV